MKSQLQCLEVEPTVAGDDNLPIEYAARWQLRLQCLDDLREISVERLFVAALDEDLVAVAEDQRPKAVPFRLEDPSFARRQLADSFGEHRQNGWIDRQVHALQTGGRAERPRPTPGSEPPAPFRSILGGRRDARV